MLSTDAYDIRKAELILTTGVHYVVRLVVRPIIVSVKKQQPTSRKLTKEKR